LHPIKFFKEGQPYVVCLLHIVEDMRGFEISCAKFVKGFVRILFFLEHHKDLDFGVQSIV
jgi:hypothetical protein